MAAQVKVILGAAANMMLVRPASAEVIALAVILTVVALLLWDARQQRRPHGYVYVLAGSTDSNVKIGITNDLERRLREHSTALPTAYYVHAFPARNPARCERLLHQALAGVRVHQNREWFAATRADRRALRRLKCDRDVVRFAQARGVEQ